MAICNYCNWTVGTQSTHVQHGVGHG